MAGPKKARIRKSAPTIREKVELAKVKADAPPKQKRVKPLLGKTVRPLKKLRLPKFPKNRFTKALAKIFSFLIPRYFINSWKEVKQVTWPNRKDTWRLTLAVIIFAIIFGGLVAAVDKVLDILFKNLVLK